MIFQCLQGVNINTKNSLFLLLFTLLLCQCSKKDPSHSKPDAYFKIDSTYIGIRTIAKNLDEPWEITWGPDNWIWMTEFHGTISKINPKTGKKIVLLKLKHVYTRSNTPGLLGMAIEQNQNKFPYLFIIYDTQNAKNKIVQNVVRYTIKKDTLVDPKILLVIPGAKHHQGSRLRISPKGKLFIADGDAARGFSKKNAQDIHSLVGKVLRINIDGSIPKDNPFPGSPVWAWGFRNQEGLTFGKDGNLYDSMDGPASDDEVNLIKKGRNYGWPNVNGYCNTPKEKKFCADSSVIAPIKDWTPTISPAGMIYYNSTTIPEWKNSLLLTTLKDKTLYVLPLYASGDSIIAQRTYLRRIYGRLRDICSSPNGEVYISTSNRDWKHLHKHLNGFPKKGDDRIVELFPIKDTSSIKGVPSIQEIVAKAAENEKRLSQGAIIYKKYCASCHRPGGEGIRGTFPPLVKNKVVNGDRKELISVVLNGKSGPIKVRGVKYNGKMPAFKSIISDKKLAQVLTYIRSHFTNHSSKVPKALIKSVRNNDKEE
jgi:glucose/arabinose dehydrogenase/mono/diheme cytochrome c family protein